MIAFLIKVRVKTIFSAFNPIKVEPLELCYLRTVLNGLGVENYIIDGLFGENEPKGVTPDLIILTGYNVAESEIIRMAGCCKAKYPDSKVMVGGVHVQRNSSEFHVKAIDYVFHSQSLKDFRTLIERLAGGVEDNFFMDGVDVNIFNKETGKGFWHVGNKKTIMESENVLPDRDFFDKIPSKFNYLEKRNVALIKGSIGCPYTCSYCYCKEINQGHYVKANYDGMAAEMEKINADYFWIVDDVLLSNRRDALDFMESVNKKKIKGKIIAYLRADFILREKDLLKSLKRMGLVEVIVGFEATNNNELEGYGKTTDALDYPAVISLLKQNGIDLTALFMVKPDYGFKDFKKLRKFIADNNIQLFTVSILTPIKGTEGYEQTKDFLVTNNPKKFDFMHLVVKSKLAKPIFYALFYGVQLKLLKSRRIWKQILRK